MRLAHVGRRQGPAFDEATDQQARLVVDHLGREPPVAGRLLADDLIAAVDSQQRALLAQPRDIRLVAGPDHEVVIGDPAGDAFDVDRPPGEVQPAQAAEQSPLGPRSGRPEP